MPLLANKYQEANNVGLIWDLIFVVPKHNKQQ